VGRWREDERWEMEHPLLPDTKGKGKSEAGKRRFIGRR